MVLGDRDCICEISNLYKIEALKPGANARLEY